jgi:hypothetical protein
VQRRSSFKTAPDQVGRTIGYGIGFVNSGGAGSGALKPLEKTGYIREISAVSAIYQTAPIASNQKRRFCALPEICC